MKRLNYRKFIKETADIVLYFASIVLERSSISKDSTRKRSVKVFVPLLLIVYLITIPFHIFLSLFFELALLIKSFFNLFNFYHAAIISPMNLPELEIYIPTSLFEIIPNLHFKELLVTCLKNSALNKSEFKRISVDLFIFTAISSILSYFVISTELYFKYFKYIVFLWLSLFTCFTIYNNEREVRKSRKFIMYLIETIFMALYFLKIEGTFSTATKGLFLVISLILLFDRILNSYFELKEDVLNGTDPIFCFLYFSESDFNKLKCTIINKIDSDIKDQLNLGMCYLFGSEKVL